MKNYIKSDGNTTVESSVDVELFKEGDYMVAYCPALELSSFGNNEAQAKENFEEALDIFIEETIKRGTLEKVLLDLGWSLRKKPTAMYKPPKHRIKYPGSKHHSFEEKVLLPI